MFIADYQAERIRDRVIAVARCLDTIEHCDEQYRADRLTDARDELGDILQTILAVMEADAA